MSRRNEDSSRRKEGRRNGNKCHKGTWPDRGRGYRTEDRPRSESKDLERTWSMSTLRSGSEIRDERSGGSPWTKSDDPRGWNSTGESRPPTGHTRTIPPSLWALQWWSDRNSRPPDLRSYKDVYTLNKWVERKTNSRKLCRPRGFTKVCPVFLGTGVVRYSLYCSARTFVLRSEKTPSRRTPLYVGVSCRGVSVHHGWSPSFYS